jgi:hypothetical protein
VLVTFFGPSFLTALWKRKRRGYFMQDGMMAHFVNYTIDVLNEAYIDHIF